jgi:hypothetical protein
MTLDELTTAQQPVANAAFPERDDPDIVKE